MFPDKSGFKFMVSLHLLENIGISTAHGQHLKGVRNAFFKGESKIELLSRIFFESCF